MSHGKRSITLITALLAVLLALGIPAAASSDHSNSSSSSDRTSQNHSRDESDADHDRGYGNDGREDNGKDKDNGVEDATSEPVLDPQIDADAPVNPEPASDLDESVDDETIGDEIVQEGLVDEATEIDAPDDSAGPSEVTMTDDESVADGHLDDLDTPDIVDTESTDDLAADGDESQLPTNGSTNPLDALEVNSVDEVTSVEMAAEEVLTDSSIDAAVEKPTESVTEAADLPDAAVEAGAASEKPSDTVQAEKSTVKPDRDESASDRDKGYGNDDKEPKTKEDKTPDTTSDDVATPDDLATPGPVEVDMTKDPAPALAVEPVESPASTDPGTRTTATPQPVVPSTGGLLVMATPGAAQPLQTIEAVDPGPEVTALLTTERITQSALATSAAESANPGPSSVLIPLGRMPLPPAGLALVDLLSDTDAPTLIGSNSESVTEAAQQAAGLVAVPAALTALALLGWALKPVDIKASAGVAGRNG